VKPPRLKLFEIKPNQEKSEFRFRFSFLGSHPPIEIETSGRGAMLMMGGLRQLQARYKIPIPREVRPSGKPTLRVVVPDDD
jgi:hypothetical protein